MKKHWVLFKMFSPKKDIESKKYPMLIRGLLNKSYKQRSVVYQNENFEIFNGQECFAVDVEARKNSHPICSGCKKLVQFMIIRESVVILSSSLFGNIGDAALRDAQGQLQWLLGEN